MSAPPTAAARGPSAPRSRADALSRLPIAVAILAYVAVIVGTVLAIPAMQRVGFSAIYATDLLIGASFTTIGLLVVRRRAENRIGWLFLAIGVIEALTAAANHYAIVALTGSPGLPGGVWAAWFAYWSVSLVVPCGLFLLLLIVFPDGRPISRAWSWLARAGLVFSILFALSEMLLLPRMEVTTEIEIDNPTNVASSDVPESAWLAGMLILLGGVAALVVRYRRSSGEERQQLRWFVFAVTVAIGSLAVLSVAYFLIGAPEPEPRWFVVTATLIPLIGVGIGVPAACGVAVLRYRLWELDVVMRKTVVVALVTGTITVLYVAIVGGLGALVGSRLDSALAFSAAAVLAVAFQPIRKRAGHLADRLVYGKRATPYEVLSGFSERVGESYAAEDVLPRMAQILGQGTGADTATVWLLVAGELRAEASWPRDRASTSFTLERDGIPDLGEPAFEVRHRGELLGVLSVSLPASDPMDPAKERLVRDLASQAGLALRNVRLIEELRASRQRLVAAQDEERRKLERDLHDGAQQHLVALAVKTRLASAFVGKDAAKERAMLAELHDGLGDALETLRDLARGIYPPLLADRGLADAIEAQARRSPFSVAVDSDGIGRYPREIESAIYFCSLEALNNVAKYAGATSVLVRLWHHEDQVAFEVRDDGRGFDAAATSYGTGLQGMVDRMDAIGGTIDVTSEPGAGTSIVGRAPATPVASGSREANAVLDREHAPDEHVDGGAGA